MSTLRFTYDIVCPFAYIASKQVRALAREAGVGLEYDPVLLGGIYQGTGSVQDPNAAMPGSKSRLTRLDALRQASRLNIPLQFPDGHPRRTVAAMRLLLAVEADRRPALTDALYHAYWVDGRDISDLEVLSDIALPFDLDVGEVNADPRIRQALFDASAAAVARGAFGVPTFEVAGKLWWGADRLPFVRQALRLPEEGSEATLVPGGTSKLVFFHDFSSPFSYLASTQVGLVAEANGATLEVVPFLLGALFQEIGTPMVPLNAMVPARREYQLRDMQEWADWWGVPLKWPTVFPLRTVTALRASIVEPKCMAPVYRAAWVDDLDISDDDVLRGVLTNAGLDGAAIVDRTRDPEIKAALFENTKRAVASGACGAPTFIVDGEHLFWGQDRLPMVAEALSGWQSPSLGA